MMMMTTMTQHYWAVTAYRGSYHCLPESWRHDRGNSGLYQVNLWMEPKGS